MLVHVVIGPSGSGKTTMVRNLYIKGETDLIYHPFKLTRCGSTLLFGHYTNERREGGTDSLPFNILPKIIEALKTLKNDFEIIVLEGDRINNKRFFTAIKEMNVETKITVLMCPMEQSISHLRAAGSKITEQFVKCTRTKTQNIVPWLKANFENVELGGDWSGGHQSTL